MKQVKLRGSNYFFEDMNPSKEETILLVHGHPFDHTMWRYQYAALSNFRLILPDLKGYGKSDYHFDKIFIEEQALDLALLLDHCDIEKIHLIGLSMGAQIIVEFARLFPHRSKSLIICDSNPASENETSYLKRLQLAAEMEAIGMTGYTESDIHKYLHPATIIKKGEVYNHLYKMMTETNIEGAVASHRGRAERRNNYTYLKQIEVPTLVIAGDKDFFTPVTEMKAIADEIKGSTFIVIEKAGHMPNMEQAEVFNKTITEFYKTLLGPSSPV